MKLALASLIALAACDASAQSTNAPPAADQNFESQVARRARQTPPIVRQAKPNEIIGPRLSYEGILVDAARHRNVLQLFNPFAPAEYGSAMDNVVPDPLTRHTLGLKFLSIKF